ncbi:hypothetical protein PR003_g9189 [Phytophthora rubi]|uniref:HAT C-terminal dimerisation domain-containing protein n=1 Tax=Phytophthora rubi TaxID=129364 RepID=A0A6A3MYG1_9STRA|nr:hypothetical protein PR002_g22809 [Phytophthora rubi]KAE9036228.1 hypothetical protein PR001_g8942 [Phytophthora rubi]KAE9343005.1 hypothetical protein PR003_g9189 [Phytophthora rubi]
MDGKVALVLPVNTRWGKIERCFASIKASEKILHAFVYSRDFLRSGSKEQKAKRRHAHDTVVARDFVKQLGKAIRLLSVLSVFQKAFEKNAKPPSDIYRMFLELPKIYRDMEMPIGELGKITRILEDRFNFIYGDAHGVAYLLDPRYLGRGMDEDTRQQVDDFITAWNGPENEDATAVELVKYLGLSREGLREAKLIADGKLKVLEYWRGLFQFPMLQEIALTVFAASCSIAGAERNFSAHKFVHSQARNRLQDASVEKLVFLFFNAKNFDAEDVAVYDFIEDMADASCDEETNNRDEDFEYY